MNLANFASLFPFRSMSAQPSINTLLDSPNVTLNKLLDEESFGAQFKSQNHKLMEYLKYQDYKTLVEYIVKVGPEEDNKRSCKFPFVAAEVLAGDNDRLLDYILHQGKLTIEEQEITQVEVQEEYEIEDSPCKQETDSAENQEVSATQLEPESVESKNDQNKMQVQEQIKVSQQSPSQTTESKNEIQSTQNKQKQPSNDNEKQLQIQDQGQQQEVTVVLVQTQIIRQSSDDKNPSPKIIKQIKPQQPQLQQGAQKQQAHEQSGSKTDESDQIIDLDQYKPAKKIGTRKVIKQVVNKVSRQLDPLINDLFLYLDQQLNYILAGYFSRVCNVLFTKKLSLMTNYCFQEKRYLKFLKHVSSRSIAEFISKLITYDSLDYIKQRQQLLEQLLKLLSKPSGEDINVAINVSFVLSDVIEKLASGIKNTRGAKQLISYVYTNKFCQRLLNSVVSDVQQVSIYSAPVLLTALTSIQVLNDNKQQTKNTQLIQKYTQLISSLKLTLAKSSQISQLFKNFTQKAIIRLGSSTSATLGLGRIKLVETIFYLLKFDLFDIRENIISHQLILNLFALMKKYQMNNVLHNEILKIISFIFETPQLNLFVQKIIEDVINFLFETSGQDTKIQDSILNGDRSVSRKGYIGHIVKIGQLLKKLEDQDKYSSVFENQKWKNVRLLVQNQTFEAEKNLAGYQSKRSDAASNIMFSRQDILSHYKAFLTQPPLTTYDTIQQSCQDQIDQLMQRITNSLQIPKTEVKMQDESQRQIQRLVEEQRQKQQQQGQRINNELAGYWNGSKKLNYDLEDLMNQIN